MANIYSTNERGEVVENTNWGQQQGRNDTRVLDAGELRLYRELKSQERSDSSIWLEMHPKWPRGNGKEILRPLKRPAQVATEVQTAIENKQDKQKQVQAAAKTKVPIRQLTTPMLATVIEARCGTSMSSLQKMSRSDLEKLATSLLQRDYILLDLRDC